MISYELAKQLKEAGFPQKGKGIEITSDGFTDRVTSETTGYAYIPTLSELIEACGDKFECLYRIAHTATLKTVCWESWHFGADKFISGSTPEESLGKLWLALYGKTENS